MTQSSAIFELPMSDSRQTHNIPFSVKMGYGTAAAAGSIVQTVFIIFYLFFLTDVVLMDPTIAGIIVMAGTLMDAVLGPTVGYYSDRIESRFGRRRPFLLGIAIPFAISSYLMFTDYGATGYWQIIYFLAVSSFYHVTSTFLEIPHIALAAEMTDDYEERVSLFGVRSGWAQIGSMVAAGSVMIIVAYFSGLYGGDVSTGWSMMGGVFGVVSIPLILFSWAATRGYEPTTRHIEPEINFWKEAGKVLYNKTYVYTVSLFVCTLIANTVLSTYIMYFMTYRLGLDEQQTSIIFLIMFTGAVLWIPVINLLVKYFEKRHIFAFIVMMGAIVATFITLTISPETIDRFYYAAFFLSGGPVAVTLIGISMIADAIKVDELKTGVQKEGLYYGLNGTLCKIATALSVGGCGLVLSWIGYETGGEPSEEVIQRLTWLLAFAPTCFFTIASILAIKLPLTRELYEKVVEAKNAASKGQHWDQRILETLWRK